MNSPARLFLTILALLSACSGWSCARAGGMRLATGSDGGSYYLIGEELARFSQTTPDGPALVVRATSGSIENLEILALGKVDLALVTQDAYEAFREELDETDGLCVVGPLYVGAAQFVIRADLVRSGTLADLNGVLLYPGAAGSGTEDGTTRILEATGVKPRLPPPADRTLGYAGAAQALAEGRFDAATLSGGPPVAALKELLEYRPGAFVILRFSPEQQAAAIAQVPGLVASEIAGGTYAGQAGAIPSVGKRSLLLTRSNVGPQRLGALARMIERGIAEPGRGLRAPGGHPVLSGLDLDFWRQPLGLPRCSPVAENQSDLIARWPAWPWAVVGR